MMKQFLLLLLLITGAVQAQVAKLEAFANGKFYSSAIIKDDKNDVKGYFLLYENDHLAKETYQLEYVLLDENLTRVTGGFITEEKYEGFTFQVKNINVEASLHRNKLLLEFSDNFETTLAYKRYRILDIGTFELSDPFMAKDGKLVFNPKFDRNMRDDYDKQSDPVSFFKGVGLVTFSRFVTKKSVNREKYITHFDDNFDTVWKYVYDVAEGNGKPVDQKYLFYLQSDENLIVILTAGTRQNGKLKNEFAVHFIDAKTGVLVKEQAFPEADKRAYEAVECIMTDTDIQIMGLYSDAGRQWMNIVGCLNTGMFKHTYDRKTLELTVRKELVWKEAIGKWFTLDKRNAIEGEGYLFIHDILPLDGGKMIAVCEAYDIGPVTTNDMYFLEFSAEYEVTDIYTAARHSNKFPEAYLVAYDFKKYGLLDFVDYQDLGDNEYVFLFLDHEKDTKNRKDTNLFGIVSYIDGKFSRQTIDLKSAGSTRHIVNAKKGYMLIREQYDDKNKKEEMRLEKINY